MDEKMIEDVAKALHEFIPGTGPWKDWEEGRHAREFLDGMAKAAIQATGVMEMREALEAMMEGNHSPNERGVWGCVCMPSNEACTKAAKALSK